MQFQFRNLAFQTEKEPTVGRGGIIDAIAIADETLALATQVEQLIPVRAIA